MNKKSEPERHGQQQKQQWSPELEQRLRYIESVYDKARSFGLDLLKLLLGTVVVVAGVPIIFYEKVIKIFPGASIAWIWASWVAVFFSLMLGLAAFLFLFEGYYHHAHKEWERWLGNSSSQIGPLEKRSNGFLNLSHWSGILAGVLFVLALLCVCIPTIQKIYLIVIPFIQGFFGE